MEPETSERLKSLLSRAALASPAAVGGPASPNVGFGSGFPDPAYFPLDGLADAARHVLEHDGAAALQYTADFAGDAGLRDLIAQKVLREDERSIERAQVILTSGGSQALSLLFFALVDPGDVVLVESPTYGRMLTALRQYGATLVSIPVDEHGMRVDELERALGHLSDRSQRPKVLYTIPTFHSPTGTCMAPDRRRRLVDLARSWNFVVAEDDTYRELRFEGVDLPSLFSLDQSGLVVRIGTFSKLLAPGIRLGWAAGHEELVARVAGVRHDLGASPWIAKTVARFLAEGHLERHVQELVRVYRGKRDRMAAALGEHCGGLASWRTPQGGFHLWLELASRVDPEKLAAEAAAEGVRYLPGPAHYASGGGERNIRLAFSQPTLEEIDSGIAALGRALARSA